MNIQEKIAELEKQIAELKNAVEEKEIKQEEPKFERKTKRTYYYISALTGVVSDIDSGEDGKLDIHRYKIGNYFHTRERAEEVAEKIRMLLKLERLHDIFCPDYNPDINDLECEKYFVWYDIEEKSWKYVSYIYSVNYIEVFFSTEEIAKKVCEILNAEIEDKKC